LISAPPVQLSSQHATASPGRPGIGVSGTIMGDRPDTDGATISGNLTTAPWGEFGNDPIARGESATYTVQYTSTSSVPERFSVEQQPNNPTNPFTKGLASVPAGWLSYGAVPGTLQPGQTVNLTVTVRVPANATLGVYTGTLAGIASLPPASGATTFDVGAGSAEFLRVVAAPHVASTPPGAVTIAPGASGAARYGYTAAGSGRYPATVTAVSVPQETHPLTVTTGYDYGPLLGSGQQTYALHVANHGAKALRSWQLTLALPTGVTPLQGAATDGLPSPPWQLVSADAADNTYVITEDFPAGYTLAPGASAEVLMTVRTPDPSKYAPVIASGLGSEWGVSSAGFGLGVLTAQLGGSTAAVTVPADAAPGVYAVTAAGTLTGHYPAGAALRPVTDTVTVP
jgi:alpha-galactosidase-like protein